MTTPPPAADWSDLPAAFGIHTTPPNNYAWQGLSQDQINQIRSQLIQTILQVVVQALTGFLTPGGGVGGLTSQITSWVSNIPFIGPLLASITGSSSTGGGGLGGLGTFFNDLLSFLGGTGSNPGASLGLGTGSLVIPGVGSIPLLGGVLGIFQTVWDDLTSAATGVSSTGNTLASLASALTSLGNASGLALGNSATNTNTLGIQYNKAVTAGLEATVDSNIPIATLGTGSTPSTISVTQAVSGGAFYRVSQNKTYGFLQFWGKYSGTVTNFYLNFAKMNAAGAVTPLFSSADEHTLLSTTSQWYMYTFPGVDEIAAVPGDVILVEYQIIGSGTLTLAGLGQSWQTNHPTANTQQSAFTRSTGASGPTTLSSSFTNTGNTPYIGLGVSNVPANYQPPETTQFTASGTFTVPSWQVAGDKLDWIPLGAGGGGGGSIGYGTGAGGSPGVWGGTTLVCGTDYVAGTVFTVTLGTGGGGGGYGSSGSDGGSTTISWTDPSSTARTITVAGGLAGGSFGGYAPYGGTGEGPGNHTYNGILYTGGANVGFNSAGSPPGGGGGGAFSWTFGASGANGGAWAVARQP